MVSFQAVVTAMFPNGIGHNDKDRFNVIHDTYDVMTRLGQLAQNNNVQHASQTTVNPQFEPMTDWLPIEQLAQQMGKKPYILKREAGQLEAQGILESKKISSGKAGRKLTVYRLKAKS
jgi:hypothetical protein